MSKQRRTISQEEKIITKSTEICFSYVQITMRQKAGSMDPERVFRTREKVKLILLNDCEVKHASRTDFEIQFIYG